MRCLFFMSTVNLAGCRKSLDIVASRCVFKLKWKSVFCYVFFLVRALCQHILHPFQQLIEMGNVFVCESSQVSREQSGNSKNGLWVRTGLVILRL